MFKIIDRAIVKYCFLYDAICFFFGKRSKLNKFRKTLLIGADVQSYFFLTCAYSCLFLPSKAIEKAYHYFAVGFYELDTIKNLIAIYISILAYFLAFFGLSLLFVIPIALLRHIVVRGGKIQIPERSSYFIRWLVPFAVWINLQCADYNGDVLYNYFIASFGESWHFMTCMILLGGYHLSRALYLAIENSVANDDLNIF